MTDQPSDPSPDPIRSLARGIQKGRLTRSDPVEKPPFRRLRGYAFDPSLSIRLDTLGINEIVFKVAWEETLSRGPVGEYIEVIDYDPASNCFYEPVDLNHPRLMAQDGLAPTQGNPQFHQQMVYAVAMTTIRNFEKALGRKALWRSHTDQKGEEEYVQRLRIYPHAMRESNAYYSPKKKALLFGYFPASTDRPDTHMAGGTVFTCLSHDIIAHETTHALLDGMHRRFIEPTHPDGLAFHEAFSDIVALFQHFSFPEVLRHQIAQTRGDLSAESLLGQLAQEFGVAVGGYGSLRDAIGKTNTNTGQWERHIPNPQDYYTITEPHARGAILVAAVFDSFIAIYKDRVADLMRIASNGTGVLPLGALHPDLVRRLADEASTAAMHILLMCIRALDYCPPVDLTFGDYLRALITADTDLVPSDDRGYRVSVIEAFRRRGIYPPDVRNLSIESLRWPSAREKEQQDFDRLARKFRDVTDRFRYFHSRREMFEQMSLLRARLHEILATSLRDQTTFERLTGLALRPNVHDDLPGLRIKNGRPSFEVHSLRPAQRVGSDGSLLNQLLISIIQTRDIPYYKDLPGSPTLAFRGGCTLILDLDDFHLDYRIVKPIDDDERLRRQLRFAKSLPGQTLRSVYFGAFTGKEPFALLHRD